MVKKSPENTTPAIVDNVEALEAKLAQMREAQALFAPPNGPFVVS